MNRSVIVYGPMGCGKTRNAERLMRHFGLTRIIDDWSPFDGVPITGALILANDDPGPSPRFESFAYADAARMAGIAGEAQAEIEA